MCYFYVPLAPLVTTIKIDIFLFRENYAYCQKIHVTPLKMATVCRYSNNPEDNTRIFTVATRLHEVFAT